MYIWSHTVLHKTSCCKSFQALRLIQKTILANGTNLAIEGGESGWFYDPRLLFSSSGPPTHPLWKVGGAIYPLGGEHLWGALASISFLAQNQRAHRRGEEYR